MKKILFIISDLESGGFQKSLISLLQCFDFKKYKVDLLILSPKGIFMNQLPKNVRVLNADIDSKFFEKFPSAIIELINCRKFKLAIKRLIHFLISRFDKGKGAIYMSKEIPAIDTKYDVAIDYNGQQILYYMVDKIKASKKITYFHSDYNKWDYYKTSDKKYYPKVDYIVTISEICRNSLIENFPLCEEKIKVIENISSPMLILSRAKEELVIEYEKNLDIIITTVGRPSITKGYDLAIKACSYLKKDGYKIRWYSIGVSNEIDKFKKIVKEYDVEDEFVFIGETDNPYKYIYNSDLYIHPSRFEGKSVAVDEAKILNKPIIVTNFSTVFDQITNNLNGIICKMDAEDIYKKVKLLINNKELKRNLINNLKSENLGNESEVEKLYRLIE